MRFLKPILAGATVLALALPAMASAQTYDGYRHQDSHRDGGYQNHRTQGDYRRTDRSHVRAYVEPAYGYGYDQYREYGWDRGDRHGHRQPWRRHQAWNQSYGW